MINATTKKDFLTASQLAKKLGYDKQIIEKAMKLLSLKNTKVKVSFNSQKGPNGEGTQLRPAVYNSITNLTPRLHPAAENVLIEMIKTNLIPAKD